MPKILAREWMASATLFSNPEYVWTTNHCLFVVAASPLISDSFPPAAEDPLDHPRQHDVHAAQEQRQDDGDHDHHHRGVHQFLATRPGDLAAFGQDLLHEFPYARDHCYLHPPALAILLGGGFTPSDASPAPGCAGKARARNDRATPRQWQGWRDSNPHPPDL